MTSCRHICNRHLRILLCLLEEGSVMKCNMLWNHRVCYMQRKCIFMVICTNEYLVIWIPFPCWWLHAAVVKWSNTHKRAQISCSSVSLVKLWLFSWKRYSLHFAGCSGLFPWSQGPAIVISLKPNESSPRPATIITSYNSVPSSSVRLNFTSV
jgi:hypothetical protein